MMLPGVVVLIVGVEADVMHVGVDVLDFSYWPLVMAPSRLVSTHRSF